MMGQVLAVPAVLAAASGFMGGACAGCVADRSSYTRDGAVQRTTTTAAKSIFHTFGRTRGSTGQDRLGPVRTALWRQRKQSGWRTSYTLKKRSLFLHIIVLVFTSKIRLHIHPSRVSTRKTLKTHWFGLCMASPYTPLTHLLYVVCPGT